MKFHFQQALRAIILFSFAVLIIKLHISGDILKYINPKYENLSLTAAFIFLVLFLIQLTRTWSVKDGKGIAEHHGSCCSHGHAHDECCHHPEDHSSYDETCHHDHGYSKFSLKKFVSYSIIIFPLLTGFFLPAKTLDASIAQKKGAMLTLSNQETDEKEQEIGDKSTGNSGNPSETEIGDDVSSEETEIIENGSSEKTEVDEAVVPEGDLSYKQEEMSEKEYKEIENQLKSLSSIKMDDYYFSSYYEFINKDVDYYKGRKISLKGFVYKEEGFKNNQFVVSRFLITHCVADASIIGFLSELDEAPRLETDSWVEVEGVLDVGSYNGMKLPIIKISKWKTIQQPKEPYIYPIVVQLL